MDNAIKYQLKLKKVDEMKSPIILMNSEDFINMKNKLEKLLLNFSIGDNPKYANVPIKTSEKIQRGAVIVHDDAEF